MNKPMNEKEDCITMVTDSGESVDFYVLEETRIHGKRLSSGDRCTGR